MSISKADYPGPATPSTKQHRNSSITRLSNRLRFISARSGSRPMQDVRQIFNSVLAPLYGNQETAVEKIEKGHDRKCRLAYDPESRDPEAPLGLLVFKSLPSDEHADLGLPHSFEVKTLLLVNAAQISGHGFGSALLHYAVERAHQVASKSIHVTISEEVMSSMKFFVKRGFKLVTSWDGCYKRGVTEYLMARRLDEDIPEAISPVTPTGMTPLTKQQAAHSRGDIMAHHKSPESEMPPDINSKKRGARTLMPGSRLSGGKSDATGVSKRLRYGDLSPASNISRRPATQKHAPIPWIGNSENNSSCSSSGMQGTSGCSRQAPQHMQPQWPERRNARHHDITLMRKYMLMIRDGSKTVEGRINAGLFRGVREGDTIRFFCKARPNDGVTVRVEEIRPYKSFGDMLHGSGLQACLPDCHSLEEGIRIYDSIPGYKDRAAKSGVLALHMKVLH